MRSSAKLKTMQELYKTDPQKVFSQLRITPVSKDGTINGYRFSHNDRALMREIGLTTRDVITAVNGKAVRNWPELVRTLADAAGTRTSFSLIRDGAPMAIDADLNSGVDPGDNLGIAAETHPVVEGFVPGSAAAGSGIPVGARLLTVDDPEEPDRKPFDLAGHVLPAQVFGRRLRNLCDFLLFGRRQNRKTSHQYTSQEEA